MRTAHSTRTAPTPSLRQAAGYFVRLLVLVRPYWGGIARGLLLGLVVGALGLVTPYFSKLYFDSVYPARDFSLMHALVIGVAAFTVASTTMGAVRTYYAQIVSSKLGSAVGVMYFNHLQHLPIRFFDEHRVGEVMSRVGDVRAAVGTIARVFQTVLVNGVYVLLVPPFLFAINPKLSLIALVTTPITIGVSTASSRVTRRYMKRSAEAGAELGAMQMEALSQIRTLKTLAVEHELFSEVRARTSDLVGAQLKASSVGTLVGILNATIRAAGAAVYTWYAWTTILRGEMTLGSFMAFGAYLGYLTGPVSQIAGLFTDFQQTAVTLGRAFEYLDVVPEQDPQLAYARPAAITTRVHGDVRFENVSFGYEQDRLVLHDLTAVFAPDTVTALVGFSGAGKSSILRLLCRMNDPTRGTIRLDGAPLHAIPLRELRRQVAVVWQEPTLFRGTIWENLTFGLDSVAPAAVEDVVHACRLDSLLRDLPDGYDTPVAEWGATLSGGQRQRFALARALLRDAPILLLDEATSQVDVRTEEEILRELILRVRGKTVVFATHRMSTAAIADQICVLEAGRLIGAGRHEELARQNRAYTQMLQAAHAGEEHRRLRMLGAT